MMKWIPQLLISMALFFPVTGCGTQAELQAAHRTINSLEEEVRWLSEGVPPAIYQALADYVFREFKEGRVPMDLIQGDRFDFYVLEPGKNTDSVPKAQIDFQPVLKWFQEHPATEVESMAVSPSSRKDRVWIDLQTNDGFFVRVAFKAYGLVAFSIAETPFGE